MRQEWLRDTLSFVLAPRVRPGSIAAACALFAACFSGCFGAPDYEGRLCESGNICPAGFTCGADGRCHKPNGIVDAGLEGDAAIAPDGAAPDVSTPNDDATVVIDPDGGRRDADEADAGEVDAGLDGGVITDGGGPDPARCTDLVTYPSTGWEARHFSVNAGDELETCLGVENISTDRLDRNYQANGPITGQNDRFGTRYTARRTFGRGVQTFTFSYDDGIRIFINGALIFEDWRRGVIVLDETALSPYLDGAYDLMIEHFENSGLARIKLDWARGCGAIDSPLVGWNVAYYRLSAGQIDYDECYGVEFFGTDDFAVNWGSGAPISIANVQNSDNWGAVGYGRRSFFGLTQFFLDHDDGLRINIGGTIVYDAFAIGPQVTTQYVHASGEFDVRFELLELVSNAHLNMSWLNECDRPMSATTTSWIARYYSVIYDGTVNPPQWSLNYSDCRYAEVIPTAELDFDWMSGSPPYLMNTYNLIELWGADFSGPRDFGTSTQIGVRHDDGLRVYLDGTLAYDSWMAPQVVNASFSASGNRDVFLQYFENLGGAGLHFNY